MLALKANVDVKGLSNEIMLAIMVAYTWYQGEGLELVLTSISDGQHMPNSLHYKGNAVDIRLPGPTFLQSPESNSRRVVNSIRASLTDDYDVVLERDHIHIEYDPKVKRNGKKETGNDTHS